MFFCSIIIFIASVSKARSVGKNQDYTRFEISTYLGVAGVSFVLLRLSLLLSTGNLDFVMGGMMTESAAGRVSTSIGAT